MGQVIDIRRKKIVETFVDIYLKSGDVAAGIYISEFLPTDFDTEEMAGWQKDIEAEFNRRGKALVSKEELPA